ncbi:MAG: hypothetical protein H6582_08225 [Crocinitomicaceae bacterium]|nr:hypothetical protein [Crocinitomicaceae bacterium]
MVDSVPAIIRTNKAVIEQIDHQLLYVKYHDNIVIEPEDLEEAYLVILHITNEQPFKVASDLGRDTTISSAARKRAEELKINAIAEAIVFHSLAQRLLVKFYWMFRSKEHPIKVFQSKDEALLWLKNFEKS